MIDESERQVLRSLRDRKLAEMARLAEMVDMLSEELGEATPPTPGGGGNGSGIIPLGAQRGFGSPGSIDPVAGTADGEYLNYTSTDAAYDILKKFGNRSHPLKTKQIYEACKKGGVQIGMEQALYRSLGRSHRFKLAGRGSWGLSDWYPKDRGTKTVRNAQGDLVDIDADDEPDDVIVTVLSDTAEDAG
jgi:hypothetical protein